MSAVTSRPRHLQAVAKPSCQVISMQGALQEAVVAELEHLLARAHRGELFGIAYAVVEHSDNVDCGSAGNLGRDRLRAAGALHLAIAAFETM